MFLPNNFQLTLEVKVSTSGGETWSHIPSLGMGLDLGLSTFDGLQGLGHQGVELPVAGFLFEVGDLLAAAVGAGGQLTEFLVGPVLQLLGNEGNCCLEFWKPKKRHLLNFQK